MRLRIESKMLCRGLLVAAALWAGAATAAIEVDGFTFDDGDTVAGQKLVLNGAAPSQILSSKATVVGLYMAQKANTPEAAFAAKGAKRLRMVALKEISAKDLATVLLDRIKQNATREEVENNILQLAALGAAFNSRSKLVKGDVVTLDWLPTPKTTEIRINNELATQPIQGDGFYPIIMKVWMGPKVRANTRNGLLGIPN
ncbi:hypothetical protein GCM10025771_18470 [Niveibacterium umoris]|uniref:Chalcone isomerase domain-containing protein n=1 Tax=Niveibacterium umoris TaxID=1193620 RepID=A0A840BKK9_9RHOO|nr:chalcone isomerase family protein [Niveibacterium umoris]MBB4012964.1 hypothetical protein [Niveibacterium umoris]